MIIIVGAGIAGLSLGWQLAKRGQSVTILERGKIGSGASGAAAAYLEPRLGTGAMRALEWASIDAWPAFAANLEDASGISVDYRQQGQLRLAFKEDVDALKADAEERRNQNWRVDWLDRPQLIALEPHLSGAVVGGVHLPDLAWVDAQKLCMALAAALKAKGGRIEEGVNVQTLSGTAGKITGVITDQGVISGGKIVLCTGAVNLDGAPDDVPRAWPVRGVMLTLAMDPSAPLISHLMRSQDGILCPRADGALLVGTTHEEGETSSLVADDIVDRLLQRAALAVPAVRDLPIRKVTSGLRGLVGDGLLRLGKSKKMQGLYYSLSHAGAGFLRAPTLSKEFADFITAPDAACPMIDKFLKRA